MLYIHRFSCISPQQTFPEADLEVLNESADNKLKVTEPKYPGISESLLRRMGKAVRLGVGSALPLLMGIKKPNGIIIGTANGGMEDCIKFLNQIIEYDEGLLTPTNFVQSTPNAISAQIGLLTSDKGYNITHVHRGLAFENALLDAAMMLKEDPSTCYLLGAVDEISSYNFNIDFLAGWYKKEPVSNHELFDSVTDASIAGEGATMFQVDTNEEAALAKIEDAILFHTEDASLVKKRMKDFIDKNIGPTNPVDLFLTGENGDIRMKKLYEDCEAELSNNSTIARFKHMCGEYPTASAFAVWLAVYILQTQKIPGHMIKKTGSAVAIKTILIYNNYKGLQHSFILLSK
jgi:hypothetical protein